MFYRPLFPCLLLLLTLSPLSAQTVSLTFRVDMSQEQVSANGVHVAGNFQLPAGYESNWAPATSEMADPDGDQIYELTVSVPPGSYLFKYVNGSSWGEKPELPSPACSINDGSGNYNREVSVGATGRQLPVVTFDSCNASLRLSVNMEGQTIAPEGIFVMGDFQEAAGFPTDWAPAATPLRDPNADGTYELNLEVPPGNYQYVFLNGAEVEEAPQDCTVPGPNGWRVRSAEALIGGSNTAANCFGTCTLCDPNFALDYDTYWWNDDVFYEIFVRSFYDSDGDGIGDFQGVIEKLDYLNDGDPETDTDLGITGIWLMPMMASPSYHGYDVTDYYATEPDYGSMQDFEELLQAAHARGIKVIIDFVMNHSSNQHPWFTQSANGQNGFRDWYIWSDSHPGNLGPWGQPIWHSHGGEFYYGLFWSGMPDLNYSHPPVKEAMFDIAEFWLDKGVDGFRLDAIKYLDENGPVLENTPETFQLLEDFRTLYKGANPEAMTVGEVWSSTASVLPYIQEGRLDLCFEFDLAYGIINAVHSQSSELLQQRLRAIQAGYPKLQYATFLTNHDMDRIYSQMGQNLPKMKQAALLYLTLPGIPFIYYGEEIGMTGTGPHENIRRPMQWTDGPRAGFSSSTPWIALGNNHLAQNVETLSDEPGSLLQHYRQLVHLRREQEALRRGYLLELESSPSHCLSYARIVEEEAVIVVTNLEDSPSTPVLSMPVSSLPPGDYVVNGLLSGESYGTLSLDSQGGVAEWKANGWVLPGRGAALLHLQAEQVNSNSAQQAPPLAARLFPNPVSDAAELRLADAAPGQRVEAQLLNAEGKLLQATAFNGKQHRLSLAGLSAGLYFLRVKTGNKVRVLRLVVE